MAFIYVQPKFEEEWTDAQRYPELAALGLDGWLELCNRGYPAQLTADDLKTLSNTTATDLQTAKRAWAKMDPIKRDGVRNLPDYEMSIVVNCGSRMELLGGNTRLTWLVANRQLPTVWIISVPTLTV